MPRGRQTGFWAVAAITLLIGSVMALNGDSASAGATPTANISGSWNISFSLSGGGGEGTCSSEIVQADGTLTIASLCDIVGESNFTGTIDKNTGAFSATDTTNAFCAPISTISGSASPDGNSMSGDFNCGGNTGTFTGSRKPPTGGIAVDPDLGALTLETPGSSGGNPGLLVGIAAAVATGVVALGGGVWYASRRVTS